jgi:exosortase/archaeosortase family protein
MIHPAAVTSLVFAATWSGWWWYLSRIATAPEEAVSLIIMVVFLAVYGVQRRGIAVGPASPSLPMIAMALAGYTLVQSFAPSIFTAAIAIAVSLACLYVAAFRHHPPPAFWGLVALALPVLPSLQFVLGYPMRVLSATLTVGLLQIQGLSIERQGTFLLWRGEMVQFDAPCSGVNMLWAGVLLTLMGGVLFRFSVAKLAKALAVTLALTVVANALRAASLFYLELGLFGTLPAWWHDGIGMAAFLLSAAGTLWVLMLTERSKPC